jgi:hypothetical protein
LVRVDYVVTRIDYVVNPIHASMETRKWANECMSLLRDP